MLWREKRPPAPNGRLERFAVSSAGGVRQNSEPLL